MSFANTTDAGSNDMNTNSTETSKQSTMANTSSTQANTPSTGADTGSIGENTSSTVAVTTSTQADINSTEAISESTEATIVPTETTTLNPRLFCNLRLQTPLDDEPPGASEEIARGSSVCIKSACGGYIHINNTRQDQYRRPVFITTSTTDTSRSYNVEFVGGGENDRRVYFRHAIRREYIYDSTYPKGTFGIENEDNFKNCTSDTDTTSDKICPSYARRAFSWIDGRKFPESIFDIIPVSTNRVKFRNHSDNRYLYGTEEDAIAVVAGSDASDGHMLWGFEPCPIP